jgi:hypothetical protein
MGTDIQVVIDCAEPDRLATFWAGALGYKLQDPPDGYVTWEEFLTAIGIPRDQWNNASAVVDPDGAGPRFYFQRVPEGKVVKNRVHVDLNVSGEKGTPLEERKKRVDTEVERLRGLGAGVFRRGSVEHDEYWVVMQDPEGNEFCVQ